MSDVVRLDADEIKEIAAKLAANRLVVASAIPPDMVPHVFPVIALGGIGDLDVEQIGNVYEELDKAGPMAVNGYPIFLSAHIVHKDDWSQIIEKALKVQQAVEEALADAE